MNIEQSLRSDVRVRSSVVCDFDATLISGWGSRRGWQGGPVSLEEIQRVFAQAPTLRDFAEEYALSFKKARKVLEAHGIPLIDLIAQQNSDGASLNDLSRRHGPKPGTLSKWLVDAGYTVEHGHLGYRADEEAIINRYEKIESVAGCAKRAGVSWQKARSILDQAAHRKGTNRSEPE